MKLVAVSSESFPSLQLLRDAGVPFIASDDADELRKIARDADALLVAPRNAPMLRALLPHLHRVRWIHTLAAGVDPLPFDVLRELDITVTNSRGLYADALGEFAIAAMLWFAKDLRRLDRNQSRRLWEPFTVQRLEGSTAGVIGFGGIGRAVGRRAESMGMRVLPVGRRDGNVDEVVAASDYLVISAALTPATKNMLSADRIARMKNTAVLINISRGALIDEDALIEALRSRRIRGAALDVFTTEPLPSRSSLWDLDNVLLSPHSADHTEDAHHRAVQFFVDNLRRFERGEALQNIVDKEEGY